MKNIQKYTRPGIPVIHGERDRSELISGPWGLGPNEGRPNETPQGGRQFGAILWSGKWLLCGCALTCAAVALIASFFETPLYKAKTSFEIEDLNDRFMQLDEVDPVSKAGSDSFLQTQMDLLASTALQARVVNKLHLDQQYESAPVPASGWTRLKNKFDVAGGKESSPTEMAIADLRSNLEISAPRGSSRVVTLQYSSSDPKLAAQVLNVLGQEFVDYGVELRIRTAQSLNTWLTPQLDQSRQKLQASEEQLLAYGRAAGLLFTDDNNSVAETKLKQIQDELSKAQAERVLQQSTYEVGTAANTDALVRMAGSTALQDYDQKLTELRRQLAEANTTLMPAHYKVQELKSQIAEVESALQAEETRVAKRMAGQYGAAQRREALLQQAYDRQASLVSSQDAKASRYNFLKNEVATNRLLYNTMLQRVKGVSIAAAARASNVAIFDPAEAPTRPYKPNPGLNATVGLASGLLLGSVYLFLRTRWDRSVREPGRLGEYLKIPELGAIPRLQNGTLAMPGVRRLARAGFKQSERDYTTLKGHLVFGEANAGKLHQVVDSLRAILVSLMGSHAEESAPKVLVVTSPSPNEGKTTIATSLAVALASIGKRVLLVDADLRKPQLHEIFECQNESGLSELLLCGTELDLDSDRLSRLIQPTGMPNLSVLTSGSQRFIASSRIYTSRVSQLFDVFRASCDVVLIDTPPVLAVPDARVLARQADGVVLVCRAGATDREGARVVVDRLLSDGAHILGTILNDVDPRESSYGSKYHSYYSHAGDAPSA